jgi:hypothetical protein
MTSGAGGGGGRMFASAVCSSSQDRILSGPNRTFLLCFDIAPRFPTGTRDVPHWYWLSWLLSWPVSCWIGQLLTGRAGSPAADGSVAAAGK